jgi:hypothetical protein
MCVLVAIDVFPLVFFSDSVESTGAIPPEVLVAHAVRLLEKKCDDFLLEMDGSDMSDSDN